MERLYIFASFLLNFVLVRNNALPLFLLGHNRRIQFKTILLKNIINAKILIRQVTNLDESLFRLFCVVVNEIYQLSKCYFLETKLKKKSSLRGFRWVLDMELNQLLEFSIVIIPFNVIPWCINSFYAKLLIKFLMRYFKAMGKILSLSTFH